MPAMDPVDAYVSACRKFVRTEENLRKIEETYQAAIDAKKAALVAVALTLDCSFCNAPAAKPCVFLGKRAENTVHAVRESAARILLAKAGVKE